MSSPAKDRGLAALICVALAAATLVVFWDASQCGFVDYDDPAYITSNAHVQAGLSVSNVKWAFATGAASNWHPLTWLSHMTDVDLYGMNPAGHHLTSVILHALNAALLFLLLRRMTGATWRSAFVAAAFALHPLRVESVVWVSERKDVLSTFFWMLSVWSYIRYAEEFKVQSPKRNTFYVLSLLFFLFGLMSKPMLVTLPLVLALLDYWPLQRVSLGWGALMREKMPFLLLSAASSVVTLLVQKEGGAVSSLTGVPMGARIGNAFISYVRYMAKMFWPTGLSPL